MKPKVPEDYKEAGFCEPRSKVIACSYVMVCKGNCDFYKKYHPVERAKYLAKQKAKQDAVRDIKQRGLDTTHLGD